jgi:membrane-associated phospholipid phosphatase
MFPKKSVLVWGGLGILAILAAFALDAPVDDALRLEPEGRFFWLAGFLSRIGDWPPLVLIGLGLVLFFYLRGRRDLSRLLLLALAAGMLAGFSASIIRSCTGRTRPNSQLPQGFYGMRYHSHWKVGKYDLGAFPSGHTATVAGLTAAFWMIRRRWAMVFAVFALGVAWSRIALNRHHFSDVVAAVVWGVLVGRWLFLFLDSKFKARCVRT